MSYVVLALKWRPQTFDEVAGQDAIGHTLKNAIDQGRTAHAYLFTGPRGVGKTSTARILAKALNCVNGPISIPCNECDSCREITTGRSLDVLEIDGASNRGIDDIRELRESVRYAPAGGRVKVYIIDEVHMLTTDAFNALLKTLEEPPSHVVFVLATTEILKVPATIVSRCQRFDFARLRMRDTLGRLQMICAAEGIEITEDGLSLIARRAEGSMRDALTILDQVIASGRKPLDGPGVAAAIGISGRDLYFEIGEAILAQDPHRALAIMSSAYDEGQNLQEVAEELVAHMRNLLVLSDGADMAGLVEATDAERERYCAQAERARAGDLIRQLHIAIEAAVRMRRSAFPRVLLEVAIAEICLLPRSVDLANWVRAVPESAPEPAGRNSGASSATDQLALSPTAAEPVANPIPTDPVAPGGPWADVLRIVRGKRPALAATLASTQIAGEDAGYLKIRFPAGVAPFQKAAVESADNRPILQAAIREAYGRPLGWKIDPSSAAAANGNAAPEAAQAQEPGSVSKKAAKPARGARSNLADIERIADRLDGDIVGPS